MTCLNSPEIMTISSGMLAGLALHILKGPLVAWQLPQYVMKEKRRAEINWDKKETTLQAPPSTNKIALIKPLILQTCDIEVRNTWYSIERECDMSGWVREPMFDVHKPQCEHQMCAWESGWANEWNWWCRYRTWTPDVCMWTHLSKCCESWCDHRCENMNVNECGCECVAHKSHWCRIWTSVMCMWMQTSKCHVKWRYSVDDRGWMRFR